MNTKLHFVFFYIYRAFIKVAIHLDNEWHTLGDWIIGKLSHRNLLYKINSIV